jgi:HK97 family phage portal protein
MSLLSRLLSPFQKSVNTGIFSFFSPASMPHMTERQYLAAYKGWTYACVNAIAEAFAEIEIILQEKKKDGWQAVEDHKALDPLHKVNPFQSFLDLTYSTQAYLELDGNAFWYLVRNGGRAVSEIWYLNPVQTHVVKDRTNFIKGYVFTTETGEKVPFEPEEIIHFKRFNPQNQYRGIGTVQAAAIPIDIDSFASEWQRNFFGNSAMPSGILSTEGTLTEEQYVRIKASWDARHQGLSNAHKMALLEGGLKWQSISPTNREMEFGQSRKDIRDEILAIFRVPKPVLGILEDVNLASAEAATMLFTKFTVKPKMRFFVDRLNEFYLPQFGLDSKKFRLHFKDPVPENAEQKRADRESGIKNYYMTIDEARAQVNLKPLPDGQGDKVYIPANMVPLEMAGQVPANTGQDNGGGQPKEDDPKGKSFRKAIEGEQVDNDLPMDYINDEVEKQNKVFLGLNDKLRKQLLKQLKKAKSAPAPKTYVQRLAQAVKKDEESNELVRLLFEGYDDWIGLVYNASKDGMQRVLEQSGKNSLALLEVDSVFDVSHPRVLEWLDTHALQDTDSYTGNIREDIILKVMEGVESGASNEDIGKTIGQWFDDNSQYRALRIARTETINAYGAGALEGYKQSGVVAGKYWMPDSDACQLCLDNVAAGTIALNKDFPSGHDAPTAHPNCECSLGAVTKKD